MPNKIVCCSNSDQRLKVPPTLIFSLHFFPKSSCIARKLFRLISHPFRSVLHRIQFIRALIQLPPSLRKSTPSRTHLIHAPGMLFPLRLGFNPFCHQCAATLCTLKQLIPTVIARIRRAHSDGIQHGFEEPRGGQNGGPHWNRDVRIVQSCQTCGKIENVFVGQQRKSSDLIVVRGSHKSPIVRDGSPRQSHAHLGIHQYVQIRQRIDANTAIGGEDCQTSLPVEQKKPTGHHPRIFMHVHLFIFKVFRWKRKHTGPRFGNSNQKLTPMLAFLLFLFSSTTTRLFILANCSRGITRIRRGTQICGFAEKTGFTTARVRNIGS
eukprot:Sdes_comp18226_c0_seq1m7811